MESFGRSDEWKMDGGEIKLEPSNLKDRQLGKNVKCNVAEGGCLAKNQGWFSRRVWAVSGKELGECDTGRWLTRVHGKTAYFTLKMEFIPLLRNGCEDDCGPLDLAREARSTMEI